MGNERKVGKTTTPVQIRRWKNSQSQQDSLYIHYSSRRRKDIKIPRSTRQSTMFNGNGGDEEDGDGDNCFARNQMERAEIERPREQKRTPYLANKNKSRRKKFLFLFVSRYKCPQH